MSEIFGAMSEVLILGAIMGLTQILKDGLAWKDFKAVMLAGMVSYVIAFPYYALTNLPLSPMVLYQAFLFSTMMWLVASGGYKLVRGAGSKAGWPDEYFESLNDSYDEGFEHGMKEAAEQAEAAAKMEAELKTLPESE